MPDGVARRVQEVETAVAEEIDRVAPAQHELRLPPLLREGHLAQVPALEGAFGDGGRGVVRVARQEGSLEARTDDEVRRGREGGRVARVIPVVVTVLLCKRDQLVKCTKTSKTLWGVLGPRANQTVLSLYLPPNNRFDILGRHPTFPQDLRNPFLHRHRPAGVRDPLHDRRR